MRTLPVLVALVAALVLAAPASAAVKRLEANLRGSVATDEDGRGKAKLRLNRERRRVCFTITVRNIDDVVAAHVHRHSDGGIAVDLITAPESGRHFTGCTEGVSKRLIRRIVRRPRRYYVNVHTTPYPGGAIQGTLRKPPKN
jgi:plasmid stabilization system protein ParE